MILASLPLALTLWTQAPAPAAPAPRQASQKVESAAGSRSQGARRSSRPRQPIRVTRQILRDFREYSEELTQGSNFVLGNGTFTSGRSRPQVNATPAPQTYTVNFPNTGTIFAERVLVGLPGPVQRGQLAPVLVMFHGYNRTEASCYEDGRDLFVEAQNRGWYVIAPLGAHTKNYGIDYAQDNIEYALSFLLSVLPIDPERVYGVGFSMGGGGAMSYGARHMDPNKPRFAAIVNHTGGTSTAFVYWNSSEQLLFQNPLFFAADPTTDPFRYSQASCVDVDQFTQVIDPNTDLVRNLQPVPVLNYHATADPNANLVLMTQLTHSWMGLIPGFQTFLLTPSANQHQWDTMDTNTVLNFLYSHTLSTPTEGQHRVLADRDARWHHFTVTQDATGAFTPFRWDYDALNNRLTIDETQNLADLKVHSADLGLDTAQTVEVIMMTTDGSSESTTLTGYATAPQDVKRAGVSTGSWTWDSVGQTVTLMESNPAAGAIWEILP